MNLSEQAIKKICSPAIYKRGIEYFNQGRVHIKNRETQGFTAVVDGEDLFNVRIGLSDDGEITDYFCTCPYYDTMGVACKHIVAAAEERRRELEGGNVPDDENDRISKLFISDFSRGLNGKTELSLMFEVFFSGNGNGCEVKLYLFGKPVNNPEELIECFVCKRPLRLGKSLDYHPDTYTFGAFEESILSILSESYESRPSKLAMYTASSGTVRLGGEGTKRMMSLLPAVDYKIVIDRMDLGRVLIAEENPEILIDISAMFGEITMYVPNYGLALVPDASVFFYEGTVFLTDKAWQKKYLPVYRALSSDRRSQITFKGDNALAFATYVLPSLENEPGVVCDGLDEYVIKDKPEFTVYVDSDGKSIRCKVKVRYGEISFFLPEQYSRSGYIVVRDTDAEYRVMHCFDGFIYSDGYYNASDDGVIYEFITEKVQLLAELCDVVESDLYNGITIKKESPVSAHIEYNFSANLLEATPDSKLTESEIREILRAVKLKEKFYRSKNGDFYDIQAISGKMSVFDRLFFEKEISFQKRSIPEYNMLYLSAISEESGTGNITCSRELLDYVKSVQNIKASIIPELRGKLRPYQITGADWLKQISSLGFGGILADDMGLGKTVQMLAFLHSENREEPVLIVTPSALTYNWRNEFNKFIPDAKVLIYDGNSEEREEKLKKISEYEYIIISYPILRRDIELYKDLRFSFCILDEAQAIKNPQTMSASAVKRINAGRRFALTGTPIENSMKELWSIFDFLLPAYLGKYAEFKEAYELPAAAGNKDAMELLKKRIKPFILRRMKKDVLSELPEKLEEVMYAKMTEEQSKLYASYRHIAKDKALATIAENGRGNMEILTLLLRLRQISCHPSLFDAGYKDGSGKLDLLFDLVETALSSDHRILVFSQFTSMLSIIGKGLDERSIKYFYIDGSTNPEQRVELCNRFNNGENGVFLISLKAGGTGLNLTGADTVIHYDPWWNPAVTDQASDRAYRIGQTKNVHVIRLAAADSVEAKIISLQEKKRNLANDIININNGSLGNLSSDEILSLFE